MKARRDLTGQRFGQLTVLHQGLHSAYGAVRWLCQCDCGSPVKLIEASHLLQGQAVSCGCRLEAVRKAGAWRKLSTYRHKGPGEREA